MARMTVTRRKDTAVNTVMMHKVADIRGGVSVNVEELGGDTLFDGATLSKPEKGICHVVKFSRVAGKVEEEGTEIQVDKRNNHFVVGDFVMIAVGAKASKITKIDRSGKAYDTITVEKALGEIEQGGFVVEAKAEASDSGAALKRVPFSITGTSYPVEKGANISTDAIVIGVTMNNPLPEMFREFIPTIVNL